MRCNTMLILMVLMAAASASASAQQRKPAGWIADPQSGCRTWNPSPSEDERITWAGPCVNGFLHGKGVLRWFSKEVLYETDEGEFRNGKLNGQAILSFTNGTRFEGQFRDQIPNGQGTYRAKDGQIYSGQWTNGCFNQGGRQIAYNVSRESCGLR